MLAVGTRDGKGMKICEFTHSRVATRTWPQNLTQIAWHIFYLNHLKKKLKLIPTTESFAKILSYDSNFMKMLGLFDLKNPYTFQVENGQARNVPSQPACVKNFHPEVLCLLSNGVLAVFLSWVILYVCNVHTYKRYFWKVKWSTCLLHISKTFPMNSICWYCVL